MAAETIPLQRVEEAALLRENTSKPREANHTPDSADIIHDHLVWIRRDRKKVLVGPVEARWKELLAEIATQNGLEIIAVEVMPDHVHWLVSAPPKISPTEMVRLFKGIPSRRMRKEV